MRYHPATQTNGTLLRLYTELCSLYQERYVTDVLSSKQAAGHAQAVGNGRRLRADAQRSIDVLISAARELFATTGVDATTREIADKAGVGMGTLFRRFPQRADLIAAVFHGEIDACADAADDLAAEHQPFEALARWMQAYAAFISTKRGLAKALSSGDPVFVGVFARFEQRLRPAAQKLYEAAVTAGEAKADIDAAELLCAVSTLCMSTYPGRPDHAAQMSALLVEGVRRTKA